MFLRLGNGFYIPFNFFNEWFLADITFRKLADFAGEGFAIVHMEVELDISVGFAQDFIDDFFHFFMSITKFEIPR